MTLRGEVRKAHVEATVQRLWQGDLVRAPLVPVLESPHSSFVDGVDGLEPVDEQGLWTVAPRVIDSGWAVIVTQTCDVVRHPDRVPYLQLMPLVALSSQEWEAARNGRRGSLFALPASDDVGIEFPAIDCSINFPVSKAALLHVDIQATASGLDPAGRLLLSSWLMRRVGRFAFPDPLEHHVLAPLRRKVASAIGKNSQSGAFCRSLLGVWSSTEWSQHVSVIFIVDPNLIAASRTMIDAQKAIDELTNPMRKSLADAGSSVQIVAEGRSLADISAYRLFIEHRQVDMDALPTGAFVERAPVPARAEPRG